MSRMPTTAQLTTLLDVVSHAGDNRTTAQMRSAQKRGLVTEGCEVTAAGAAWLRDMMVTHHRHSVACDVVAGSVMLTEHNHAATARCVDALESMPAHLRGARGGATGCDVRGWQVTRAGLGVVFVCIGTDRHTAAGAASINVAEMVEHLQAHGLTVASVRIEGHNVQPDDIYSTLTA